MNLQRIEFGVFYWMLRVFFIMVQRMVVVLLYQVQLKLLKGSLFSLLHYWALKDGRRRANNKLDGNSKIWKKFFKKHWKISKINNKKYSGFFRLYRESMVRFVTNESTLGREGLAAKLYNLGFRIDPSHLIIPLDVAKYYLRKNNLRPHLLVHRSKFLNHCFLQRFLPKNHFAIVQLSHLSNLDFSLINCIPFE